MGCQFLLSFTYTSAKSDCLVVVKQFISGFHSEMEN